MHQIGDKVRVDGSYLDDVGQEVHGHLAGKIGQIFQIDWNHDCGSDDEGIDGSNTDPMYRVGFDNGEWGHFFEEELERV